METDPPVAEAFFGNASVIGYTEYIKSKHLYYRKAEISQSPNIKIIPVPITLSQRLDPASDQSTSGSLKLFLRTYRADH